MHRKADHTCINSLQERRRKKQIHQVSEHVEKRTTMKEVKDDAINGRRKEDSIRKEWCTSNTALT